MRAGLSQAIHATAPGELVLIDFLGGSHGGLLPKSPEGYQHLLIAMDCFTRYTYAVLLRTMEEAEVAEGLMRDVFSHLGLPRAVHSDNAQVLIRGAVREIYRKLAIKPSSITFRHPQGNSPVERFMRYLNSAFTIMLPAYSAWSSMVPLVLFVYQTLPHETTGFSPFFMMFGRKPLLPIVASSMDEEEYALEDGGTTTSYVRTLTKTLLSTFATVRKRQIKASEQNAERRDDNRFKSTFATSDPVLYYDPQAVSGFLGTGRTTRMKDERNVPQKWKFKWSGPHPIVDRKSDNVYLIYHHGRKKVISANVDSLVLYHPFAPLPWEPISTEKRMCR